MISNLQHTAAKTNYILWWKWDISSFCFSTFQKCLFTFFVLGCSFLSWRTSGSSSLPRSPPLASGSGWTLPLQGLSTALPCMTFQLSRRRVSTIPMKWSWTTPSQRRKFLVTYLFRCSRMPPPWLPCGSSTVSTLEPASQCALISH